MHRVRLLVLTSVTFDGIVYDPERVMEEPPPSTPRSASSGDEPGSPTAASCRSCGDARRWPRRRHWATSLARAPTARRAAPRRQPWAGRGSRPHRQRDPRTPPAPHSRPRAGARLRHAVDAQVAVGVPPGLDDSRVGLALRAARGRALHRGLPRAHHHIAQPPAGRVAGRGAQADGPGGVRHGQERLSAGAALAHARPRRDRPADRAPLRRCSSLEQLFRPSTAAPASIATRRRARST